MNTQLNVRKSTIQEAWLAGVVVALILGLVTLSAQAQPDKDKEKPKDEKAAVKVSPIEISGYSRPGNPEDGFTEDGQLIRRLNFAPEQLKKFKIMGGTVYFAVFKNTALVEGDTFATGMGSFDAKFEAGRSFKDGLSPRFDKRARYLYLYQVVNDRNLDPRINQVKGKVDDKIKIPFFVPGAKTDVKTVAATEDIGSFALKLMIDPRYITSWGHFRESGFASMQADYDNAGKPVRQVVDKVEQDKIMLLAFSHLAPTQMKISHPGFGRRARAYPLGDLENGFTVAGSVQNLQNSKAQTEIKEAVGKMGADDAVLLAHGQRLVKAAESAKEPDFVQLMYLAAEERAQTPVGPVVVEAMEDDVTRAIFRVDWRNHNSLKQGYRSVVFGFTSDQPPMAAPIRIDTPKAAIHSEGMKLASYFAEDTVARASGDASGIVLTAGADSAAVALALGTALGSAVTPQPAAADPGGAPGFAGITGGFGLGGTTTGGGGGGGFGVPGFSGSFSRPGPAFAGGGGLGGGTGSGNGTTQASTQPAVNVTTNFEASLLNQQQQWQAQLQAQLQQQNQNNNNRGHCGHGHVVPAPASLLLALLGLPGLLLLRRRGSAQPEVAA